MCICVNCRHVQDCITYYLIKNQHHIMDNNRKINNNPFIPRETLINININYTNLHIYFDWDLIECLSFTEKPGYWII
uniref:Ycf34 n=1 Tax=Agarophyton chilense TaxID=2510777 RepID=A0A141SEL3_AGACH|nr:hypothetical protein Gchil_075 [Agarophyton chilense]AMK96731.1 hypothetical protein Gchil_075 [Agarophyton chilense]ASP44626.1 hypothetical protein [Agarophyton chilense]UAD84340.1 hypothetical protein [Agarophyton chilense]